jgi:hypothetical protein
MRRRLVVGVVSGLLITGSILFAQAKNVSPARHPNLAAAQRLCSEAVQKIDMAQQANEFDMGGHAKKAKELLVEAADELKQAALTANAHGH